MERNYQKEKQEKEAYRSKLISMGVNLNTSTANKPEVFVISSLK